MASAAKNTDYEKMRALSLNATVLGSVCSLLEWDQETHMPPAASGIRSLQSETLAGLAHQARTNKEYGATLDKLISLKTGNIAKKGLSEPQKAALKAWRHDFKHDTALSVKFVEEFAKLTSQAQLAWRQARKDDAFHQFSPFLEKIITMCRKKADLLGYKKEPYDALMDLYEPEATAAETGTLFTELKKGLTPLLKKIMASKQVNDSFLNGKFDTEKQLAFGKLLLKDMGYDMERGRLDLSTHPFSSSAHPTDSRITTRIHPTSLISNISTILHEGGHSLYEMGLPVAEYGTPLCQAVSLGVHESQSRWWETRIGQSLPFWSFYLPKLKKAFKGPLDKIKLDAFYKAVNKVEPSFIRVEADEVTYSLHVILRFEIERGLINGTLKVRDIPEAWNAAMKGLLGITPKDNRTGCLQDIHWSMGGFGYFPTYTLGNLYAAHFFKGFEKAHSDWEKRVAKGELAFIKEWLHQHVHCHGRRYSSKELLQLAWKKPFTAETYIQYLSDKYKKIYGF